MLVRFLPRLLDSGGNDVQQPPYPLDTGTVGLWLASQYSAFNPATALVVEGFEIGGTYQDAATRLTDTTLQASQVGQVFEQQSDSTYWTLTAVGSPNTWAAATPAAAGPTLYNSQAGGGTQNTTLPGVPWLWARADALSLADGAAVTAISDMSGQGHNPVLSGSAVYRATGLAGKPAIELPSGSAFGFPQAGGGNVSAFAVVLATADTFVLFGSESSTGHQAQARLFTNGQQVMSGYESQYPSLSNSTDQISSALTTALGSPIVASWLVGNSTLQMFEGAASRYNAAFSPDFYLDQIGRTEAGGQNSAMFRFAEVIVYDSLLSAGNAATVQNYLKAKYGL